MRRPDVFTLDYSHPLAQGLLFASIGGPIGRMQNRALGQMASGVYSNSPITTFDYIEFNGSNQRAVISNMGAFPSEYTFTFDITINEVKNSALFFTGFIHDYLRFDLSGSNVRLRSQLRINPSAYSTINTDYKYPAGTRGVFSSVVTTSGARALYTDGVIEATGQIPVGSTIFAPGFISPVIAAENTASYAGLRMYHFFAHNRALSPAEIALLADRTDPMLGGLIVEERSVLYFDMGGAGTDALTALDLVVGSPVLGAPALGQAHAVTASGITVEGPVLGAPTLAQIHALVAPGLAVSTPGLGAPVVGQAHSLVASALVAGAPVLGTPLLSENAPDVDALTADNLVVGSPVLGAPALGQIHVLGSVGLVTGAPVFGTPALEINTDHLVAADLVVGSPVLDSPTVGQVHLLSAVNLSVSAPMLGTPSLEIGKDHLAAADLIVEGPVLGTPALQQVHALVAGLSTSAPVLDAPVLRQAHVLIADGLSVSSPVLGAPMLFDLEYVLQTRAELKSTGTTDFTASSFGTTHVELRCYGNYEVNEFGE